MRVYTIIFFDLCKYDTVSTNFPFAIFFVVYYLLSTMALVLKIDSHILVTNRMF